METVKLQISKPIDVHVISASVIDARYQALGTFGSPILVGSSLRLHQRPCRDAQSSSDLANGLLPNLADEPGGM